MSIILTDFAYGLEEVEQGHMAEDSCCCCCRVRLSYLIGVTVTRDRATAKLRGRASAVAFLTLRPSSSRFLHLQDAGFRGGKGGAGIFWLPSVAERH